MRRWSTRKNTTVLTSEGNGGQRGRNRSRLAKACLRIEHLEVRDVPSAFTPGNLVIYRVGDGAGTLVNTGNQVFLDEYTSAGSLVQSIALPTTNSGPNKSLIASGTATSEGLISLSPNNQFLALTGYNATPGGATSLSGTTSATVNRVVGIANSTGSVDTTTALTDYASANNPRSAVTTDGTNIWVTGGAGGIRHTTFGTTTSTQISATLTNLRQTDVVAGQLYISTASGAAVRLGTVGTGTPTTSGQTITNLPGFPTSGSPYGFFFADLNATPGNDTVYVAEDTASGGSIQRYSLVSGSWTADGTAAAAGVRGLTGVVVGAEVILYGTTGGSAAAGGGSLYSFTDTTGYDGTIFGTATALATAATNTAFRGIAHAPLSAGSTFTVLTSSPNPANIGQSITFQIGVVGGGSSTPTGTASLYDGATLINTVALTDGRASYSTTLSGGTHSITAVYNGDVTYSTSTSLVVNQVVGQASTTGVVSDVNPSVFGQQVTFTATVSGSSGTPTGNVDFKDGATTLATVPLTGGSANYMTSSLTVGGHSITVLYSGDSTYSGSTSSPLTQTVNTADSAVVVVSNNNPSNFGAPVTFTATVTAVAPGAGLPTGTVEFFDGATSLGTDTLDGSGQGDFTTSSLSVGSHSITVNYLGNGNFNTSTSPAITQDVVLANVNTITTVVADINPSTYNQAVTFTATVVTDPSGQGTPNGTVEFFDGATSLGTDTLDGSGEATLIVSNLTAGSHSITATYQGNVTFNSSTSAPSSQTVNQASTGTAVVSSLNPSIFGQPVTFTATVTSGAGTPTGTVEFFDGATSLGTDTLNGSGQAEVTINTLTIGSHSITAQFLGSVNFNGSTSSAITQDVNALVTPTVVLNELSINQPGTDTPWEYIELRGTPSASLTNVFVVVLEGDTGSAIGNADFVQDLSSVALGTNGLLYIGASIGGHTIPAATTKIALSSFNTGSGAIENGANSYMIIASPNAGAIAQGTDYDTNNDGVLELPVGAIILDTVGWVDAGAGGTVYGGVVLTQSAGTPDAAVRFLDNTTPSSFAAWYNGDLAGTDPFSITFDPLEISANFPAAGAQLTPGNANSNNTPVASSTGVVADVNPSVFGESVTFTATVTVGSGTPTGSVTFKDGATTIGNAPLVGNVASLPVSTLSVGLHNVTAIYGGDVTFASSTSPILAQTVNQANTSGSLLSSVNPSLHGQSVTFTVTVSAVPPGAGLPTGTVEFFDGATSLGTDTLDGAGQADVTTSSLSIGGHSITAVYQGDVNFNTSTSAPITQTVNQLVATWVGNGAGDPTAWSNPNNWSGGIVPGIGDKAIFTFAGTSNFLSVVDAGYSGNLAEVDIDSTWSGNITLDSGLTVTQSLDIDSGAMSGNGALSFEGGTWTNLLALVGSGGWTNTGSLTMNAGSIDISGAGTFTNSDVLTVQAGTPLYNATFTNLGTVEILTGSELDLFGPFTNFSGTTLTGGTYDLTGALKFSGANIVTNAATLILTGPGSQILDQFNNDGLANLAANAASGVITVSTVRSISTIGNFTNAGEINLINARFTANGTYTQTAGTTNLGSSIKATGGFIFDGGVLTGRGSMLGSVTNNGAVVSPGGIGVAGTIRIIGNYVQGPGGTLDIEIGGLAQGVSYDLLRTQNSATIDGTMNVSFLGGYLPNNGDAFQVVSGNLGVSGTFATVNGLVFGGQQFLVNYNPFDVELVTAAFPAPPAPGSGRSLKRSTASLEDALLAALATATLNNDGND